MDIGAVIRRVIPGAAAEKAVLDMGQIEHIAIDNDLVRGQQGDGVGDDLGHGVRRLVQHLEQSWVLAARPLLDAPGGDAAHVSLQHLVELGHCLRGAGRADPLRDCVGGHQRFQTALPAAPAGFSVLFHNIVADLRGFGILAVIDAALDNNSGPYAGPPLDEQQIFPLTAAAVD